MWFKNMEIQKRKNERAEEGPIHGMFLEDFSILPAYKFHADCQTNTNRTGLIMRIMRRITVLLPISLVLSSTTGIKHL